MGLIQEYSPSHNMDQFAYEDILSDSSSPSAATTRHSTTDANCHDMDIEGVAEERVVEGDDELYIHIIYLYYHITYHDV